MWLPTRILFFVLLTHKVIAEEPTWKEERLHDYVNYTFVTFATAICAALL